MIQASAYRILYCFLNNEVQSFSELCANAGYATDLGGYYIRQLLEGGYLEKQARGKYILTAKGKQQIAMADGKSPFVMRPRLVVLLVIRQGDTYLSIKRGRQPFIGTVEWPASAVQLGEPLAKAAERILQKRLHIKGVPKFRGFFRRSDFYVTEETPFDDKLFAVHTLTIPADTVVQADAPDELVACSVQEMSKLEHPAKSLLDIYQFLTGSGSAYTEQRYILSKADLSI